MARGPAKPAIAPKPHRTLDDLTAGIARLMKRREELEQFDVQALNDWNPPALAALLAGITGALERIFGENTSDFHRFEAAGQLAYRPGVVFAGMEIPISEVRTAVAEKIAHARALLTEAIRFLEEEVADRERVSASAPKSGGTALPRNKVFVVHGHDEGAKHAVARFLEQIQLEAIILQEQPGQGLTIIEKFERYAGEVGFAVVLLTPDDIAGSASAPASATRARQNVIFELGYFAGKLGRGRACLLRKGDVEIPSDLYGLI